MSRVEDAQRACQNWSSARCKSVQQSVADDMPSVYSRYLQGLKKTKLPENVDFLFMDEMLDHCLTGQYPTGIIVTYILWELAQRPVWN
jgi:DNA-binding transcriptional regulator YbjK